MTTDKKVHIFKTGEKATNFAVEKWMEISARAVEKRGRFLVALSGGNTPVGFYRKLSDHRENIPWEGTYIFQVDERFVPPEDTDSNFRSIEENLLEPAGIPEDNVYPVPVLEENPVISAARYENMLIDLFDLGGNDLPEFDLIVLGIGEDGHTASLFPGTSSLDEDEKCTVAVSGEGIKHDRVSLTFPVINSARNVMFLVLGDNKSKIAKKVIGDKDPRFPASRVEPYDGTLYFLLDVKAAAEMS